MGQHGFNSTNSIKLSKIKKIFGANKFNIPEKKKSDKNKEREFLYLLGKPRSTWENDTNKRIISEKVQKTGPACKLKMTLWYEEINGARIEFGIQTETQTGDNREFFTYSEFHSILFIDDPKEKIKNDTSHGWTTFSIPVHQYNTPFKLSIDVKRNI